MTEAVWQSWRLDWPLLLSLLVAAGIYFIGWRRLHRRLPLIFGFPQLGAYYAGLASLYLALGSPLDTFSGLFLTAHMAQHILLMMVIPPLLLLGSPFLPLLTGLPKPVARDVVAPFLSWPELRAAFGLLVHPLVAGPLYIAMMFFWHSPHFYDLALRQPGWHRVEHLCFLGTGILFWWPVVKPFPSHFNLPEWWIVLYLWAADVSNTALSAFLCFFDRVFYRAYETPVFPGGNPLHDQATAGAMMWVLSSIIYLVPAGLITVRLLGGSRGVRPSEYLKKKNDTHRGGEHAPILSASSVAKKARPPGLALAKYLARGRPWVQITMIILSVAVMADGFFGPPLAATNLAGVLPWVFWRGLTILTLVFIGNAACYACPVTMVRDVWRRICPPRFQWPAALRGKWLSIALILCFLWSYEAFRLWDSPRLTALLILAYFVAAIVVDGLFKGAAFCRYVCPVGQYQLAQSLISPTEIAIQSVDVCASCRTHDCLRGNTEARGCELHLFQPRKSGNMDCTYCLDCVTACPHDNVGVRMAWPGADSSAGRERSSVGKWQSRPDIAVLVVILTFGAFLNAAMMVEPVQLGLRHLQIQTGLAPLGFISLAFVVGLGLLPALLMAGATVWSNRFRAQNIIACGSRWVMALIPIGAAMWAAHFLFHFVTGFAALPTVFGRFIHSDAAVESASASGANFLMEAANWLPTLEILLLDFGLVVGMAGAWRIARDLEPSNRRAIVAGLPWFLIIAALFVAGVWIIFQPMEMRGTIWAMTP